MYYKDTDNKLHFLESVKFEHLLPPGCVQITDSEAAEIQAANNPIITVSDQKRQTYKTEADPIYAEWQALLAAGHEDAEARHQEWIAKRAEILNLMEV